MDGKESMRYIVKEEIVAGMRFILILIAFMAQVCIGLNMPRVYVLASSMCYTSLCNFVPSLLSYCKVY